MLLLLHENFTFKIKSKIRARVEKGILKIDSPYIGYWEKIMYALAYELKDYTNCLYCGKKLDKNNLTLDHIFPKNYGGISISNNLIPCCKQCNNEKGCLSSEEYWTLRKKKTEEEKNNFMNEVIQEKEKNRYMEGVILPKEWIKYSDIDKLKISDYYDVVNLESKKVIDNKEYIEKYGHLKKPIIVDKNFWVLDGYTGYLAGMEKQISLVPIVKLDNVELVFK